MKKQSQSRLNAIAKEVEGELKQLNDPTLIVTGDMGSANIRKGMEVAYKKVLEIINKHTE